MATLEVLRPRTSRLTESFLALYKEDLEWTDTIHRVVEDNIELDPSVQSDEAEFLFRLLWTKQVTLSRQSLWAASIKGLPVEAQYSHWYTTLRGVEDWCWIFHQSLLGGNIGIGLKDISQLPVVSSNPCRLGVWCRGDHPDIAAVQPEGPDYLNGSTPIRTIGDSRDGWVTSLRKVLRSAYEGRDLVLDVSKVRPKGVSHRRTSAHGPGPLVNFLRSTWGLIREAAGRRLTSSEWLRLIDRLGLFLSESGAHFSNLSTYGDATDASFLKTRVVHVTDKILCFSSPEEVSRYDWVQVVSEERKGLGFLNLPLGWQTDAKVRGGQLLLHDREACNVLKVHPSQFEGQSDVVFRAITRCALRQRLRPLSNPQSFSVAQRNMRVGISIGDFWQQYWSPETLSEWFLTCRREADSYADTLRVNRPITVTCADVEPSSTSSACSCRQQFDRQMVLQRWWADNTVATYLDSSAMNPVELAECLREYAPQLKSIRLR